MEKTPFKKDIFLTAKICLGWIILIVIPLKVINEKKIPWFSDSHYKFYSFLVDVLPFALILVIYFALLLPGILAVVLGATRLVQAAKNKLRVSKKWVITGIVIGILYLVFMTIFYEAISLGIYKAFVGMIVVPY